MPESFGQKIRKKLDLPLSKKGIEFWFLFPFFIIFSLTIHFVSFIKRKRSYLNFKFFNDDNNPFEKIKCICIGNVLIGGTGKSPVVQKIALSFLNEGWVVAIAARGIGKNINPYYICSMDEKQGINSLSDENREHYEILKKSFPNKIFYILQNKTRIKSLQFLLSEIKKNNYNSEKTIFIMDDGLQHFSCPRDINVCLWSPILLLNSPNFAMPIGPYREGFGKTSFQNLLQTFDFRFWSRTQISHLSKYQNDIGFSLSKYSLFPNEKDFSIIYNILYFSLSFFDNKISLGSTMNESDAKNKIDGQKPICVVAGIAHPKNFLKDLNGILSGYNNINTLF